MAKATSTKPLHSGGRTLARMGKKGGNGGGTAKKKRPTWFQGNGRKWERQAKLGARPVGTDYFFGR